MDKQNSDRNIDNILQALIKGSAADEKLLDEIASSSATWWGVKRQISGDAARSPWPPAKPTKPKGRWLAILVPSAIAAALMIGLSGLNAFKDQPSVRVAKTEISSVGEPPIDAVSTDETTAPPQIAIDEKRSRPQTGGRLPVEGRQVIHAVVKKNLSTEVKSDFIALSYAATPESGQVVRVKVPRSMMVSAGLVQRVEKPSELVDAEVVVGDDGMTQAIRFISKGQ